MCKHSLRMAQDRHAVKTTQDENDDAGHFQCERKEGYGLEGSE